MYKVPFHTSSFSFLNIQSNLILFPIPSVLPILHVLINVMAYVALLTQGSKVPESIIFLVMVDMSNCENNLASCYRMGLIIFSPAPLAFISGSIKPD